MLSHIDFSTQLWCCCLIRIITVTLCQVLLNWMLFFSLCSLLPLYVFYLKLIIRELVLLRVWLHVGRIKLMPKWLQISLMRDCLSTDSLLLILPEWNWLVHLNRQPLGCHVWKQGQTSVCMWRSHGLSRWSSGFISLQNLSSQSAVYFVI